MKIRTGDIEPKFIEVGIINREGVQRHLYLINGKKHVGTIWQELGAWKVLSTDPAKREMIGSVYPSLEEAEAALISYLNLTDIPINK